jgi:hypothetical protein
MNLKSQTTSVLPTKFTFRTMTKYFFLLIEIITAIAMIFPSLSHVGWETLFPIQLIAMGFRTILFEMWVKEKNEYL